MPVDRSFLLPHLIAERAAADPEEVIIQHVDGPELRYGELHDANLRWADAYRRIGVSAGDNVVTMLGSSFETYNAWLGLTWLRAVEVPINTMYRSLMLRYVVENSRASVVVISAAFVGRLAEVAGELADVRTVVVPDAERIDVDLPFEVLCRGDFLAGAEPATDLAGPDHWDIACIVYTSGTTGPSKGVLVPWGQMYYAMRYPQPPGALRPGGAYYSYWPPFHMSGKYALYMPVAHRARLVMRETFSLSAFWEDVRRFGCTTVVLVGPLVQMLMSQEAKPDDAVNPLHSVTAGPLGPHIEEFARRFGVRVATGFGMTEVGGILASADWDVSNWQSCGRQKTGPPGFECRVVDEHDELVAPGTVGELVVRSQDPWALNAGYFGMPEKTAEAWRNGWFHTGDGFRYDEEGNFYFVDRIKDAIRRRGENISSFEVEAYVNEHPAVAECAAFGVPSELGEDEVKVCVVRTPGSELGPRELIEFLIERMPRFMVPRFVEFVESLPKTEATARVKKVELRADPLNDRTWDREREGVEVPR